VIGLDTNVLVRYLTQDDPEQASRATRAIEAGADHGETFFITTVVMCELVWVLEEAYGYERDEIGSVLDQILRTAQFEFDRKDELTQSLHDYRAGKGDFSDYLIGRLGDRAGCEATLTLDRALADSRCFRQL